MSFINWNVKIRGLKTPHSHISLVTEFQVEQIYKQKQTKLKHFSKICLKYIFLTQFSILFVHFFQNYEVHQLYLYAYLSNEQHRYIKDFI